jgi:hypothetical protein
LISYYNSGGYNVINSQEVTFITNPSVIEHKENIIFFQRDDIQKLSFFDELKHNFFPFKNIFSKEDCKELIHFLEKNKAQEKNIIIQCEYGKSRSLTTAIVLKETILNETHNLIVTESTIRNKIIYNIMKKGLTKKIS